MLTCYITIINEINITDEEIENILSCKYNKCKYNTCKCNIYRIENRGLDIVSRVPIFVLKEIKAKIPNM